jgi:hypothetical protein
VVGLLFARHHPEPYTSIGSLVNLDHAWTIKPLRNRATAARPDGSEAAGLLLLGCFLLLLLLGCFLLLLLLGCFLLLLLGCFLLLLLGCFLLLLLLGCFLLLLLLLAAADVFANVVVAADVAIERWG